MSLFLKAKMDRKSIPVLKLLLEDEEESILVQFRILSASPKFLSGLDETTRKRLIEMLSHHGDEGIAVLAAAVENGLSTTEAFSTIIRAPTECEIESARYYIFTMDLDERGWKELWNRLFELEKSFLDDFDYIVSQVLVLFIWEKGSGRNYITAEEDRKLRKTFPDFAFPSPQERRAEAEKIWKLIPRSWKMFPMFVAIDVGGNYLFSGVVHFLEKVLKSMNLVKILNIFAVYKTTIDGKPIILLDFES